jgi:hypothetical protein
LLESHRRLLDLPVQTIHPGHFNSFSGEQMQELIRRYARERADR